MQNKISVIIPAHDEAKYIGATLRSLKSNDIPFELIVVCDSCTDGTKEIASQYTKSIYGVDFKNISKVRNFGTKKSTGDIFVFLDADTIVSENYLSEIIKSIDNFDFGCAKYVSESKSLFAKYLAWSSNNYYKKNIGGNFFVKKEVFDKVDGFNEGMKRGEDTDLSQRLRKIGAKYGFLNNCSIIPSERRCQKDGYLNFIITSGIRGLLYKFFRKYYNKNIANKFYE